MTDHLTVVTARRLPADFPDAGLRERCTFVEAPEDLARAARDADVLYLYRIPNVVPTETPHLKWIQVPSAGVNHLIDTPAWHSAVPIVSSTGIHAVPMAEHFFSLLLALTRKLPAVLRAQCAQEWIQDFDSGDGPTEIRGKTLAIIGWGDIGEAVAHLARGFGMRVIGTRRSAVVREELGTTRQYVDPPRLEADDVAPNTVYPAEQLLDVLGEADVVLLLLPLSPATEGLLGRREFAVMRENVLFFNLGRGKVVDQGALIDALSSGKVAGAGLDVFAEEPLPGSSPLWGMENVIVSPHIGGSSPRTQSRAAHLLAANLQRYLSGESLLNVVDRDRGY